MLDRRVEATFEVLTWFFNFLTLPQMLLGWTFVDIRCWNTPSMSIAKIFQEISQGCRCCLSWWVVVPIQLITACTQASQFVSDLRPCACQTTQTLNLLNCSTVITYSNVVILWQCQPFVVAPHPWTWQHLTDFLVLLVVARGEWESSRGWHQVGYASFLGCSDESCFYWRPQNHK